MTIDIYESLNLKIDDKYGNLSIVDIGELSQQGIDDKAITVFEPSYRKVRKTKEELFHFLKTNEEDTFVICLLGNKEILVIRKPNIKELEESLSKEVDHFLEHKKLNAFQNKQILFLRTKKGKVKVDVEAIDVIEAAGNYSYLFTNELDRYIIRGNLTELSNLLSPEKFIRIHRSYIVQFNQIELIQKDNVIIGQRKIPIGKTYRTILKERVNNLRKTT